MARGTSEVGLWSRPKKKKRSNVNCMHLKWKTLLLKGGKQSISKRKGIIWFMSNGQICKAIVFVSLPPSFYFLPILSLSSTIYPINNTTLIINLLLTFLLFIIYIYIYQEIQIKNFNLNSVSTIKLFFYLR